ncbi:MAG: hypothetical protein HY703_06415 [Gemmatimonadetes bacterium]|nr:hypothetical protein [Gemmatimonadota bacterium]
MSHQPDSLKIVYEEPEGRPVLPVTGAYGGPTPEGSAVVAHLYVESSTLPSISSAPIDARGVVDLTKTQDVKRADVSRRVQATLVLPAETAIVVGKWLQEKGEQAISVRQQRSGREQKP